MSMKILALDIETSGAVVRTFSLFKPFIGVDAIIEHPRMICWSAQWIGSKKTMFRSEHHDGRKEMLDEMHRLLDEADAVITYNGKRFDMPWIYGELMVEGYKPPSPSKHIDLYQALKSNTRFISGKLDYAVQRLLDDRKVHHQGISLWNECANGDDKAWATMKRYAIKDTALLPRLYEILLPWIPNHPNVTLYDGSFEGCPGCGSRRVQRRGYAYTNVSKFQRLQCQDCGKWSRGKSAVGSTELR